MWWKKKKLGQQLQEQQEQIPIDLVLTDDLYWIFQFCNPFKPLKVALIEQAIVTWGQVGCSHGTCRRQLICALNKDAQ